MCTADTENPNINSLLVLSGKKSANEFTQFRVHLHEFTTLLQERNGRMSMHVLLVNTGPTPALKLTQNVTPVQRDSTAKKQPLYPTTARKGRIVTLG